MRAKITKTLFFLSVIMSISLLATLYLFQQWTIVQLSVELDQLREEDESLKDRVEEMRMWIWQTTASEQPAILIGKDFLDTIGYTTGRILYTKLEKKTPNFYWHDIGRLEKPEIKGPRPCWIITFEQASDPPHIFEVWIDAYIGKVIGGRRGGALLYISAVPESPSITGTAFHYSVILINSNDAPVSTSMPYVTVTLTRGTVVVYSRDIAFNMTGPITLMPHEERTIYDETIALARSAGKGTYWLQAAAYSPWLEEGPPEELLPLFESAPVFESLPALVTLE